MKHFASYHEYELKLATEILIPLLEARKICLDDKRVLDVGCGAGGFLNGLAGRYRMTGLGIDRDAEMLSQCVPATGVRLEQADFLDWDSTDRFDLLLLRDVLEHCDRPQQMLARAASLLAENGLLYVTYSPYWSPFGGHQHNGSGLLYRVPYLQLLPESLFLRMICVRGNSYKSERYLREDLKQVRRARLTTGAVTKTCRELGLRVSHRQVFVFRPDYRYKFGLPTVPLLKLIPLGTFCDPFCTSVEMLLGRAAA